MSQLNAALSANADKNKQLLSELAATDYAPPSLKQNIDYISDLKRQIANTDKELSRLHNITEDERKDHIKYRDSNLKRWSYKLQGSRGKDKYTSRQEKEEKEFQDAWQAERSAKEGRDELARALTQAESDRTNLEADKARHDKAQNELDALYNSIFSGPTPDVPGEDQLEDALKQNRQHFDQIQTQFNTDKQALNALMYAETSLGEAYGDIQSALNHSKWDMYGGGGFVDMMERDALARAQNNVNGTIRHMEEARRRQPVIQPLVDVNIDMGHFFSDVMFDNIFTDMAQHERIQKSQTEMQNALRQLKGQMQEQQGRVRAREGEVRQAGSALEESRRELQRIRAEAFGKVGGGGGSDAPPAYS